MSNASAGTNCDALRTALFCFLKVPLTESNFSILATQFLILFLRFCLHLSVHLHLVFKEAQVYHRKGVWAPQPHRRAACHLAVPRGSQGSACCGPLALSPCWRKASTVRQAQTHRPHLHPWAGSCTLSTCNPENCQFVSEYRDHYNDRWHMYLQFASVENSNKWKRKI